MTGLRPYQPGNGEGVRDQEDMRRRHYAVLADDLTGAADTAVALAGPACDAELHLELPSDLQTDVAVVAIDLDTRKMPEHAARDVTARCASSLASARRHLFKKIDSTLRGHIGAELAALYENAGPPSGQPSDGTAVLCIVAPAHPIMGRVIRYGRLEIRDIARDAAEPGRATGAGALGAPADADKAIVAGGTLSRQLQACGFTCTPLDLDGIRGRSHAQLTQFIANSALHHMPALVCDGESMDDLHRIADAALASATRCIWVGSGGLALALSAVHATAQAASGAPRHPFVEARKGSRLFVVGSYSSVARQQVDALLANGDVAHLALTAEELLDQDLAARREQLETWLITSRDIVLTVTPDGPIRSELSLRLAAGLAQLVSPIAGRLGALVCCGGDTSRALFDALGLARIRARQSYEAGITHIYADALPTLPIVLKAGAFGDSLSLARLRHHLAGLPADAMITQRRKHT